MHSRGFALIVVLWAFVLISLIVVHVTAAGRTELRIAGNLAANAAAQAAADGAIYRAIFNQLDPRPDQRWPLDGSPQAMRIGDSTLALRLANEAARINPNLASKALMQALLDAVAGNREEAAEVATAIAQWTGAQKGPRQLSGIDAEYRTAGLDYGPPGEPLQSIDELARVRGMTPALLAALRPHLTLFGPAAPDPDGDDPVVQQAVAEAARTSPGAGGGLPQADTARIVTVRISATATGPGNAVASRTAIARIGPGVPRGYALLSWETSAE
jgi:general secretion pathway protein K